MKDGRKNASLVVPRHSRYVHPPISHSTAQIGCNWNGETLRRQVDPSPCALNAKKNPMRLKPFATPERPRTLQNTLSPSLSHLFLLHHEDNADGFLNRAASTCCRSSSTVRIYSATQLSPLPRFTSACLPLPSLPLTGRVVVDVGSMTNGRRRDGVFLLSHHGPGAAAGGSGNGPPNSSSLGFKLTHLALSTSPHHTTSRPALPPPARPLHPFFPPLIHLLLFVLLPSIKSCSVPQKRSRRRTSFPLPLLRS
jgi:hypothetical protein